MSKNQPANIREVVLNKIQSIPENLLGDIYKYILILESDESPKNRILSFAGAWENMTDRDFDDFIDLTRQRRKSSSRNRREGI